MYYTYIKIFLQIQGGYRIDKTLEAVIEQHYLHLLE